MKSSLKLHAALIAAALALAACQSTGTNTGGVAGALFFGKVGNSMDESDKQKSIESIRSGTDASWTNPTSGNQYTFKNNRTFNSDLGLCRDYTITSKVSGASDSFTGSACRGTNYDWITHK